MVEYYFVILLSVIRIISAEKISDLDPFEWSTKDGEGKPILSTIVQGENIKIPLREAPFCHLAETKKCNCFILKKSKDKSLWNVASFVKCGDKVQGSFMNSSDYFEIAPREEGSSGQHIVKIHKPGNTSRRASSKVPDEDKKEKPKEGFTSSKYLRPLPEYGQLFGNETGYITVKFIVNQWMLGFQPDIDVFLQNYVNEANQYMYQLNLLIVYLGWIEAEAEEANLTDVNIETFIKGGRSEVYDKDPLINSLVLFSPAEAPAEMHNSFTQCFGLPFQFVQYLIDRTESSRRQEVQMLCYVLARQFGVFPHNELHCGSPPEGVIYIMEGFTGRNGTLAFAKCSIEIFPKEYLGCLRKDIQSNRTSCGNGLVEDGEECDCVADACRSCCDECKLTDKSVCSNGPCCDISMCQFFDDKTQCRASDDFCDIPEVCNGNSSECPPNYVVTDGYECKGLSGEKGYCFNGMCGSRDDVCRWLFEDGSNAESKSYDFNMIGNTDSGGCGPTFQSRRSGSASYTACESSDKLCGKIYCTQPGIEGQIVMRYTSGVEYFLLFSKTLYAEIKNKSFAFMLLGDNFRGLREDPTFVQNGSACGDKLMCVSQKCTSLPQGCPENCPGKKIKHPYTGEVFPASLLGHPDNKKKEPPSSPSNTALYVIIIIVLVVLIIGVAYGISKRENGSSGGSSPASTEGTSSTNATKSSSSAPKKSSSKEATSEVGRPKESSFIASSKALPSVAFKSQSRIA